MKKLLENDILQFVLRFALGFLFIAVSVGKVASPDLFANEIGNYSIFPEFSLNIIALIMAWFELLIGFLLIAGVRVKANALLVSLLMIVFNILVLSAMVRGLDINCGCYSNIGAQKVGWTKILENTATFLLSTLLYFTKTNKYSLENLALNDAKA